MSARWLRLKADICHLTANHVKYSIVCTMTKMITYLSISCWYSYLHNISSYLLYHQHYPTFCLNENLREATYHSIYLLRSYWLTILAQVKTLTVYHVSDLLGTHSTVASGQTIYYSFLNLHTSKIRIFSNFVRIFPFHGHLRLGLKFEFIY